MNHRTTHGEHCACHSCAPAAAYELVVNGVPTGITNTTPLVKLADGSYTPWSQAPSSRRPA